MFAVGNAPFATQCLTETGTQPWISSLREWNPHNKTTIWGRGIVLCWDWVSLPFGASVSEAQFPGSRLFVLREASGLLTRGVCHYHILFTKKSQPNFSKFVRFCCMRPLLSLWRPVGSYRGSPSAIHEVLILLSRLWADSAYGRLHYSRGFDLVLGIYEVLISPLSRRRGIYEANVTPAVYLRGFDLIYCTIFGMIVLNFCLSVNSVKYYYFSSFFVNFNLSYAEHPRFFCLFSGKNQRFS